MSENYLLLPPSATAPLICACVGGGLKEIVLTLLEKAISRNAATSNGFLIDGYPRELEQGKRFEDEVIPVERVIYFQVISFSLKHYSRDVHPPSAPGGNLPPTVTPFPPPFLLNFFRPFRYLFFVAASPLRANKTETNRQRQISTSLVHVLLYYNVKRAIVTEWQKLSQRFIDNSINKWRRRLEAVVKNGGGHIEHCNLA